MEKQFILLTSRFLQMNRLILFILIAFPVAIRFCSSPTDEFVFLNRLFASFGGICLLGWLFAIGHRANEKLVSQSINLSIFSYFNWTVILVIFSFILLLFFSIDIHTTMNGWNIHYVTPIYLPVLFLFAFMATILITAKTLVSTELNKEASFSEYFSTVLLMLIAAIGLWYIQPRVQKL